MRALVNAVVLGALLCHQSGFSWGNDGHEVVARIAAKHLTAKTRKAVADLLRNDTQVQLPDNPTDAQVEDAMAIVATWPDRINKSATGTSAWHFIDIGLLEDETAIAARCADPAGCVTGKITEIEANLKTGAKMPAKNGEFEPFEELKFLIHFVGDIHQPLHSATNQDAGGNCLVTTGFGQKELHAVWDTGLVEQIRMAPGQTRGKKSAPDPALNAAVAAALDRKIKASEAANWKQTTDPAKIAMESHQVAADKVYAPLLPVVSKMPGFVEGVRPGSCIGAPPELKTTVWDTTLAYKKRTLTVVRTQISKAGIRLAQILNDTFDR